MAFLPIVMTLVGCPSFVNHKVRGSLNSNTRITKFNQIGQTELHHILTGYEVTGENAIYDDYRSNLSRTVTESPNFFGFIDDKYCLTNFLHMIIVLYCSIWYRWSYLKE